MNEVLISYLWFLFLGIGYFIFVAKSATVILFDVHARACIIIFSKVYMNIRQ